jgi:hypothetical protein
MSLPVAKFPRQRIVGVNRAEDLFSKNSTNLVVTPDLITVSILEFAPSDKYESAQTASTRISVDTSFSRRATNGSIAGPTKAISGAGFPLQRFETAHVTLFKRDIVAGWWIFNNLFDRRKNKVSLNFAFKPFRTMEDKQSYSQGMKSSFV